MATAADIKPRKAAKPADAVAAKPSPSAKAPAKAKAKTTLKPKPAAGKRAVRKRAS